MNWTEEQYADWLRRRGAESVFVPPSTADRPFALPAPKRGMNKTEAAYAQHLDLLKHAGEVLWWRFEPLKFRLADGAWFKPDFGVLLAGRAFELHETKGFWREAARVRIKVAAEQFPFKFVAIKRDGASWMREEF